MQLNERMDEVSVYQYTYWDEASNERKTSTRYATMDVIRSGLGVPVFTSEKRVPVNELVNGFHRDGNDRRR